MTSLPHCHRNAGSCTDGYTTGEEREGEKNFSLPLALPTGNKEKYGWPARLGSNITQKVVAIGPAESWTSLKAWKLNPSTLIDSHVLALQYC